MAARSEAALALDFPERTEGAGAMVDLIEQEETQATSMQSATVCEQDERGFVKLHSNFFVSDSTP